MNRYPLAVAVAYVLGVEKPLEDDKPEVLADKEAHLKETLPVAEAVVHELVPLFIEELRRINGKYINENAKPNNTNPIHTPLSYLLEGLEGDA